MPLDWVWSNHSNQLSSAERSQRCLYHTLSQPCLRRQFPHADCYGMHLSARRLLAALWDGRTAPEKQIDQKSGRQMIVRNQVSHEYLRNVALQCKHGRPYRAESGVIGS
jgi:hypothetical protein